MIDLKSLELKSILPSSLSSDPKTVAMADAISSLSQKLASDIALVLLLPRIDTMPENIVDYLAWQYHVDFYQADLSLDAKRKLVKNSTIWHRHKGTKWAVEQVVSTVFEHPAHVEEWFEYGGDPYKFKITASGFENIQQLVSAIKTVKNTRSHLDSINVDVNPKTIPDDADTTCYVGIVNLIGGRSRIGLSSPDDVQQIAYVGSAHQQAGRMRIGIPAPPAMEPQSYAGIVRLVTGAVEIGGIR